MPAHENYASYVYQPEEANAIDVRIDRVSSVVMRSDYNDETYVPAKSAGGCCACLASCCISRSIIGRDIYNFER